MNKDIEKLTKIYNKAKGVEKNIEKSIQEYLKDNRWHMSIYPPLISFWWWNKGLEAGIEFKIHDDHVSILNQGVYGKNACRQIKLALDSWLKEKTDER